MSPTSLDLKNKFKYDELKKRCRAIEEVLLLSYFMSIDYLLFIIIGK